MGKDGTLLNRRAHEMNLESLASHRTNLHNGSFRTSRKVEGDGTAHDIPTSAVLDQLQTLLNPPGHIEPRP